MMSRQITGHARVHFMGTLIFILLGSLVFFSCELLLPIEIDFDRDTFNREWAAWEEQGIVNYTVWNGTIHPAGGKAAYITVRDNVFIESTSPPWVFSTISERYAHYNKIYEDAIERIEAEKRKKGGLRGIEIKAAYNKEFHYPEYITCSYSYYGDDPDGSGTFGIHFAEFTPLAPAE